MLTSSRSRRVHSAHAILGFLTMGCPDNGGTDAAMPGNDTGVPIDARNTGSETGVVPDTGVAVDTGMSYAGRDGAYGECGFNPSPCVVADAMCLADSTGSVCAPPCASVADCGRLAGAANEPKCVDAGTFGTACILPCLSAGDCPTGMQCLFLSGTEPQCAWEPL